MWQWLLDLFRPGGWRDISTYREPEGFPFQPTYVEVRDQEGHQNTAAHLIYEPDVDAEVLGYWHDTWGQVLWWKPTQWRPLQ